MSLQSGTKALSANVLKEQKGMTLIELVVAIGIAAVLAVVTINIIQMTMAIEKKSEKDSNLETQVEIVGDIIANYATSLNDPNPTLSQCQSNGEISHCRKFDFKSDHRSATPFQVSIETECITGPTNDATYTLRPLCFSSICPKGYKLKIQTPTKVIVFPKNIEISKGYGTSVCIEKGLNSYQFDIRSYYTEKSAKTVEFGRSVTVEVGNLFGSQIKEYIPAN